MSRIFCAKDFESKQMAEMQQEFGILTADVGIRLNMVPDETLNGIDITGTPASVTVKYSQPSYLYRALGLICEQENENFHISETARFESNGVMVDCSRNAVMNVQTVRQLIRMIAKMGMKTLMLYTEDTYEVDDNPYFGYMRGRYTQEELCGLDGYAADFGIELIPCIQTLGHLSMVLKWQAYDNFRDTEDILYVDKQKTYDLIEKMLSSCRKSFKTHHIHIGMDEAEMVGRGNYYYLNGDTNKFDLLCRHLKRVAELCEKYGFEPMIWSDMFFKLNNGGDYRGRNPLSKEVIEKIPKNVDLVYWEYLREEPEQYDCLIKNHMAICSQTIFAGGIWKWSSYLPSITPSIRRTKTALSACAENGVKNVFTTLWGDGGADAPFFSILPALQVQAELGFHQDVSDEQLAMRLKTCTGACLADFSIMDMPELPPEKNNGLLNPNKYLLFQDALMGLFDCHIPQGTGERYAQLNKEAAAISEKEGPYRYIFRTVEALYGVLALKAELGKQLKKAYDKDDRTFLKHAAEDILPELIIRTELFSDRLEEQWMKENKPFGFEVQGQRIGGLLQRLKSCQKRLQKYLDGEIMSIPELEERRLPFGYNKENEHLCYNRWMGTVTASYI